MHRHLSALRRQKEGEERKLNDNNDYNSEFGRFMMSCTLDPCMMRQEFERMDSIFDLRNGNENDGGALQEEEENEEEEEEERRGARKSLAHMFESEASKPREREQSLDLHSHIAEDGGVHVTEIQHQQQHQQQQHQQQKSRKEEKCAIDDGVDLNLDSEERKSGAGRKCERDGDGDEDGELSFWKAGKGGDRKRDSGRGEPLGPEAKKRRVYEGI